MRFRGSMTVMEINGSVALAQYTEELANKTSARYKRLETYMTNLVRISLEVGIPLFLAFPTFGYNFLLKQ